MTVVADVLNQDDIARLARMHVDALPESLVSLLGVPYARSFYRYCASTSEELLLVERERGALCGACLVSLEPETLSRRLLQRTPLLFFATLAVRRLPLRAMLLGAARPKDAPRTRAPEILLIFTVPEARSRGLGARLLARCEELLRSRGVDTLLVETRDHPDNRAIRFYERAQFRPIGARSQYGKRQLVLEKALHGARSSPL